MVLPMIDFEASSVNVVNPDTLVVVVAASFVPAEGGFVFRMRKQER
jgi:hypothetical protein